MPKFRTFLKITKPLVRTLKWNWFLWVPNLINILFIIIFLIFDLDDYIWVKNAIIIIDTLIIFYNVITKKTDYISPQVERLLDEKNLFFLNKESNVYIAYSYFSRENGDFRNLIYHSEFNFNEERDKTLFESFRKYCKERGKIETEFLSEDKSNYVIRLRNINYILNNE